MKIISNKDMMKLIYKILYIASFFPGVLNAQEIKLHEDLILAYEFNGNASDLSKYGNNGILHGPQSTSDRKGISNAALYFDGIDDYIEIVPESDVSQIKDFSVAVWVNCFSWEEQPGIIPGMLDYQYIFDGHSHSGTVTSDFYREGFTLLYVLKTDMYQIYNTVFYSTSNFYSTQYIPPKEILNNWRHLTFIRKGNETFHYLDGELMTVRYVSGNPLNMNHKWFVGTSTGNNPFYNEWNYNFHGKIDDLFIYKRAINECEIEALYRGSFPPER